MSVWLREIAGWALLGLGVAAFALTYFVFLLNKRVFEAVPMVFLGVVTFRGGIHLIKVAAAAKALREAAAERKPVKAAGPRVIRIGGNPAGPKPAVLPGPKGREPR